MLSQQQIKWLNTPWYNLFNNWTLTHLVYGLLWGLTILDLQTFIGLHFIFQLVEIACFFGFDQLSVQDFLMDAGMGIVGVFISKLAPKVGAGIVISFIGCFLLQRPLTMK